MKFDLPKKNDKIENEKGLGRLLLFKLFINSKISFLLNNKLLHFFYFLLFLCFITIVILKLTISFFNLEIHNNFWKIIFPKIILILGIIFIFFCDFFLSLNVKLLGNKLSVFQLIETIANRKIKIKEEFFKVSKLMNLNMKASSKNDSVYVTGVIQIFISDNKKYNFFFYSTIPLSLLSFLLDKNNLDFAENSKNITYEPVVEFSFFKSFKGLIIVFFFFIFVATAITSIVNDKSYEKIIFESLVGLFKAGEKIYSVKNENGLGGLNKREIKAKFSKFGGNEQTKDKIYKNLLEFTNGVTNSKGLILFGPPGTGKSLLASIICECYNYPYIYINGSDIKTSFIKSNVTDSAENKLRNLYDNAAEEAEKRKLKRIILFIDELDKSKEQNLLTQTGGGNIGKEVLSIIDGPESEKYKKVFLLATVNNKNTLYSAFIRPGRISNCYEIGQPDDSSLAKIAQYHFLKTTNLVEFISLDNGTLYKLPYNEIKENLSSISAFSNYENNSLFKDWINEDFFDILKGHVIEVQDVLLTKVSLLRIIFLERGGLNNFRNKIKNINIPGYRGSNQPRALLTGIIKRHFNLTNIPDQDLLFEALRNWFDGYLLTSREDLNDGTNIPFYINGSDISEISENMFASIFWKKEEKKLGYDDLTLNFWESFFKLLERKKQRNSHVAFSETAIFILNSYLENYVDSIWKSVEDKFIGALNGYPTLTNSINDFLKPLFFAEKQTIKSFIEEFFSKND